MFLFYFYSKWWQCRCCFLCFICGAGTGKGTGGPDASDEPGFIISARGRSLSLGAEGLFLTFVS